MGCGHSNRLTSDSKLDEQNKEQYMKGKSMKEKINQEIKELDIAPNDCKEFDEICKKIISLMNGKGYSDSDLIECYYQMCVIKRFPNIENTANFEEHLDIFIKCSGDFSKEEKETASKIFTSEIGLKLDAGFAESKSSSSYMMRGLFNGLRFGDISCTSDSISFLLDEEHLFCEKTMIALKYMIRDLSKFKTLVIAVDSSDNKEFKTTCHVSKIFQGIELAKNIENFSFIRIKDSAIEFKQDEMETLVDSVSSLNLKSLAIVNLNFVKTSRKKFIQNVCSNENLTMLGLQFDMTEEEFKSLLSVIKGMPKLRLLFIGFKECQNKDAAFKDEIKKNNPKIELFKLSCARIK